MSKKLRIQTEFLGYYVITEFDSGIVKLIDDSDKLNDRIKKLLDCHIRRMADIIVYAGMAKLLEDKTKK